MRVFSAVSSTAFITSLTIVSNILASIGSLGSFSAGSFSVSSFIARFFSLPAVLLLATLTFTTVVSPQGISAQNTTVTHGTPIKATIPLWDTVPPTTPILISPTNGSFLNTARPSFIWRESTDAFGQQHPGYGITHYEWYLDGNLVYGSLPLTSTETPTYSLIYNSTTQQYTLTPKQNIADGSHTWKVQVYDHFGNRAESVTWAFVIDTHAPQFIVTKVGEKSVSISAQDTATIPSIPIELDDNRPTITAQGEPNSTVQLTITIPGQPSQTITTTTDSTGKWEVTLPLLPRERVIELHFVITDQAGNVSILDHIPIRIKQQTIIITPPTIPPTASPTPIASPDPSVSPTPFPSTPPDSGDTDPTDPLEPTPFPTDSPDPIDQPDPAEPSIPSIVIPIIPPEEIIYTITQGITQAVPQPLLNLVQAIIPEFIEEPVRESIAATAPIAGLIATGFVPAVATVAVASQFGSGVSLAMIIRILQALGLLPKGAPQGIVFDSETGEPIPFALITIEYLDEKGAVVETVVTDVDGIYSGVKLPSGRYQVKVSHQDYVFPTQKPRRKYLSLSEHYRGEIFEVSSDRESLLFLIPLDPIPDTTAKNAESMSQFGSLKTLKQKTTRRSLKVRFARLSRFGSSLAIPLWLLSGLFMVIFPSIWNTFVFICYCLVMSKRMIGWFKSPLITGTIVSTDGTPIPDAFVRIAKPNSINVAAVLRSNEGGLVTFYGKPDLYTLNVYKQDLIWVSKENQGMSLFEVDARSGQEQQFIATMQPAASVYQELFGEM